MIVKEIYLGTSGVVKDFADRNIPQFSHNQVQLKVFIPTSCFENLSNFGVELAGTIKYGSTLDLTPVLVMFAGETKELNGVSYIAYSCLIDERLTQKLAQIRMTPYIKTSTITDYDNDGYADTVISVQQTFTYFQLNVISSMTDTYDVSMEEANVITQFEQALSSKKITYTNEYNLMDEDSMLNYVITNYAPSFYDGYIVVVKHNNRDLIFYVDYMQWTMLETETGKLYAIVKTANGYTKTELTYDKLDIDGTFTTNSEFEAYVADLEQRIANGEFGLYPMDEIDIWQILTS